MSAAGATARALAPLEDGAGETEILFVVLTDFPDCFSGVLGFAVCFDAATGFFVASAFGGIGFAGAGLTGADFVGIAFDGAAFDAADLGGGAFDGAAFGGAAFGGAAFDGTGFAAGRAGFAGDLLADFFAADAGFGFATAFGDALRPLSALACAAVLPCAAAFAFFARPAGAVFFFAIPASTLETRRPRVIA